MSANDTTQAILNKAQSLQVSGQHQHAMELLQAEWQRLEKESPWRVLLLGALGHSAHALGQWDKAQQHLSAALTLLEQMFGAEHSHVAEGLQSLARSMAMGGQRAKACELGQRAVSILRAASTSPQGGQKGQGNLQSLGRLADALLNLSSLYYEGSDLAQAEVLLLEAKALWESTHGAESVPVSTCLNNLGRLYEQRGKPAEGALLHEKAVALRRRLLGDHAQTAFSLGNWGAALADAEQWDKAARVLEEAETCYNKLGLHEDAGAGVCRQNLELCRRVLREKG